MDHSDFYSKRHEISYMEVSKMKKILSSPKAHSALAVLRTIGQTLKICILAAMFWAIFLNDGWAFLDQNAVLIGSAILIGAVLTTGLAAIVYRQYTFKHQMPTREVSVGCYLSLGIAIVLMVALFLGLYVTCQALLTRQETLQALQHSQIYRSWYLLAGAQPSNNLLNAASIPLGIEFLLKSGELYRGLLLMGCLLFVAAEVAVTALNIALAELSYKPKA